MEKKEKFPDEWAEIRSMAQAVLRERMPALADNWSHISGGAETGSTWRRSLQAFDGLGFRQRTLCGVDPAGMDLSVEIFGARWDLPVAIAPMSSVISPVCKNVFVEIAQGARSSGVPACIGYPNGPDAHKKMVETGAMVFRFVKPLRELNKFIEAHRLSQSDGCLATGVDTDCIAGLKTAGDTVRLGDICRPLSVEELKQARRSVDIPFVVKGILSEEDALAALEIGADAIVVSTHVGYSLDYSLSSLEALPAIVKAVGNQMTVFFDSGIRRGSDILKALALGADAVLIGRTALWGLLIGQGEGLSWILKLMADEMKRIMILTGVEKVTDLDRDILLPLDDLGDRILA